MKTAQESQWSLYNDTTGRQIDGLSFDQARDLCRSIPEAQREQWLAWHEGLADWAAIVSFAKLFASGRKTAATPPTPAPKPAAKVSESSAQTSVRGFELQVDDHLTIEIGPEKTLDHRFNKRFEKCYTVSVNHQGRTFQSQTLNISLGGMQLKNAVPEGLGMQFTATLTRRDGHSMQMQCARLPGPARTVTRLKFIDPDDTNLRAWLLDSRVE